MNRTLTEDELTKEEEIIRDYCFKKSYDSDRLAQVLRYGLDHEQLIVLCRDILDNCR
ncbi:MAG: hypothetical protein K0S18_117 [Anaerocolumna sp.]|jgi:hypothetical protein|nr:hypothetical protein [Anaerocolumna sp.]